MTKYEFLGDLSRLLSDLPSEEREEAMQYYEDYFADAGREKEQDIIRELESPEKVAAKIKGSEEKNVEYGEQAEAKQAVRAAVPDSTTSADTSNKILKAILLVVLIIVASPVILSVAAAIGGILISIVAVIFAFFCALFGSGIGLCIGGVCSLCAGLFYCITMHFAKGLVGIGVGLIMLPIGICLCYFGAWIVAKLLPSIWKLCQKLWDWICKTGQKIFS